MMKPIYRNAAIGVLCLVAANYAAARIAPAFFLRQYFSMERRYDAALLRDIEPFFINTGLLRPARVRIRGGLTFELDPRDLVPLTILRTGEWQPEVWESLAPSLKPGAVFLDVGAHIGYFSLRASKEVGASGRVLSFEPNPETVAALRANVEANHLANITVLPIACTDQATELTLYAAGHINTGASSLARRNADVDAGEAPRAFQVRGRPIDDVVREMNLSRVDAVKIDVEGAELQVLRGAAGTLRRFHPKVVLEVVPSQLASFQTTEQEVIAFLKQCGYTTGVPLGPQKSDWEWTVAKSKVVVADLTTAGQLLEGFGGIEAATWRWTRGHFSVALGRPEGITAGPTLVMSFVLPDVVAKEVKQVRLSAKIGGVELPATTFDQPGPHEYRVKVPAQAIHGNLLQADFTLDKTLVQNGKEFGLIATGFALEP